MRNARLIGGFQRCGWGTRVTTVAQERRLRNPSSIPGSRQAVWIRRALEESSWNRISLTFVVLTSALWQIACHSSKIKPAAILGGLALDLLRSLAPATDWAPTPRGDLIHMRATLHVARLACLCDV